MSDDDIPPTDITARVTVLSEGTRGTLAQAWLEWQKVGSRIAELLYVRKEQRELSFLMLDAEARYRNMRAQFGAAAEAIPQYHLASYLGIRPQSLSRLRRRIADEPR